MKNKGGRPSKYPGIKLNQVEALAAIGLTDNEIGIALDVSKRTIEYWKAKPEFLHALKKGKLAADSNVLRKLYSKCLEGDTTSIIFWLKNRRRQDWRDRQDLNIQQTENSLVDSYSDEDLVNIIKAE